MRKLPTVCHTDVPASESTNDAAIFRERARETCGFNPNRDLLDAAREVERTGGAEAVLDRAAKRAEREQR